MFEGVTDELLAKARAENDALVAAADKQYGELFDKHLFVTGAPIDPRRAAIHAMRELVVIIKTNPKNYF